MFKVGIIGAGKIGGGIIKGLTEKKAFSGKDILISDVSEDILKPINAGYGVAITTKNSDVFSSSDFVILCVKPNLISNVFDEAKGLDLSKKVIVSVAAGVPIRFIEGLAKDALIIRVMPNISLSIGYSPSCYSVGRLVREKDEERFKDVFKNLGSLIKVEEELMDSVTGLSGSGPAYVFLFLKALTQAGTDAGIDKATSKILALDTVYGAALMAKETGLDFDELIGMVKTPGGTTERGLKELERYNLEEALREAVKRAKERSKELGEVYGKC